MSDDCEASEPVRIHEALVQFPEDENEVFRAVRSNRFQQVQKSLEEGANVNMVHLDTPSAKIFIIRDLSRMTRQIRLRNYSLIHVAVVHADREVIQLLLIKGCDVNARDANRLTPLAVAAIINRPDIVELLIKNGAEVNAQSASGRTPLIEAIANNSLLIVQLLIQSQADLELADHKGTTPLFTYFSRANLNTEIVQVLLLGGCKVDFTNRAGASVLMLACGQGRLDIAQLLLDAGANINLTDRSGLNVLYMAYGPNTALYLLNNGVSSDLKDKNEKGLLERAADNGHIPLIRLFLEADCPRPSSSSILDNPRVMEMRQQVPVFDKWLLKEFSTPRNLKRLCRQVIRGCLSPRNTTHINSLPIPSILKDFLLIKHPDTGFQT